MLALTPSVQSPAAFQRVQNTRTDAEALQPLRPYDLRRYGGVGDDSTPNDAAIAAWTAACNAAGEEGFLPAGTFVITGDVALPRKLHSEGGYIKGAFDVVYGPYNHGYIGGGLQCDQFYATGLVFCDVGPVYALTSILIDGYDDNTGSFWNTFRNFRSVLLTIDITNFSVNLNHFLGGRSAVRITGDNSLYAVSEAHANTFDSFDFSTYTTPAGILQDDSKMQVNFIRSCYFEAGANIEGNFHVTGWQGDALGHPAVGRFNHLMGATGVAERLFSDFLSIARHNAALGGNWDFLDASDKPQCLAHSGGASVSVQSDATEPNGIGQRYQATFADAFDGFLIEIAPTGNDRFGLVVFYKSEDDFTDFSSTDGSSPISHSVTPVVVDEANDWKMIRISGPASKTAGATVTLFAYGGEGGDPKTISIGGLYAGGERAVLNPQINRDTGGKLGANHYVHRELVQHGSVSQSYVDASPTDIAVLFPVEFAAAPHVTFSIYANDAVTANMTKAFVKAGTLSATGFTVTVHYSPDFSGIVQWTAMGRRT